MKYQEFLRRLHAVVQPRTYLEIGIRHGDSLAHSRVPTIGCDPAFSIRTELHCDVQLVRATSDDFFARPDPLAHFAGIPVDLSFIDGMHLFEYALRDFINVEKHARWSSVVVFDDMLPGTVDEAARGRHTNRWTGDVYKIIPVLHRYRPDLLVLPVDTAPTGLALVLGLDPTNTTLADRYDQIVADYAVPDPQQLPLAILDRRCALEPNQVLDASFWSRLAGSRTDGGVGRDALRRDIEKSLGLATLPSFGTWVPETTGRVKAAGPGAGLGSLTQHAAHAVLVRPRLRRMGGRVIAHLPARLRRPIRAYARRARAGHKLPVERR